MTGDRELKRQILDVLAEMGTCRAEVAQALRNVGIHATPKDPRNCAVALYLDALVAADVRVASVRVHSRSIKLFVNGQKWYHVSHVVTVALPPSIRDFIVAFDESVYPDLLQEESAYGSRHSAIGTSRSNSPEP